MCGVSAALGLITDKIEEEVKSSLQLLVHRGPDGEGYTSGLRFALGHTRLAILGGKEISGQPFSYRGNLLAFNGEIHNYLEIAKELRTLGHSIAYGSDVPVVAAALTEWGTDAPSKFDGFFAFVFVNPIREEAIIARDPLGQKPLHYRRETTLSGERYFIASEAKALYPSDGTDTRAALISVLNATYPKAPATCYVNIQQFIPGKVLTICLLTGKLLVDPKTKSHKQPEGSSNLSAKIRSLISKSVESRLLADTPIGLLLSAGVDSGCLRSLCTSDQVSSNFVFDSEGQSSEVEDVKAAFGGSFSLTPVQLNIGCSEELKSTIKRLHKSIEAPLLSASLLALDALFKKAKDKEVPVVLSGQGADELFGGYNYYQDENSSWFTNKLDRIKKLGGWSTTLAAIKDLKHSTRLRNSIREQHCKIDEFAPPNNFSERRNYDLYGGPLATMLWYEDRIAMHHSIEVRYPFLQPELIELTSSLTLKELRLGNQQKGLLKAALGNDLPSHLQKPQPKRGLPANEQRLLINFIEVFEEGIYEFGKKTRTDVGMHLRRLNAATNIGTREAQVLFRIACAGIWLSPYQK